MIFYPVKENKKSTHLTLFTTIWDTSVLPMSQDGLLFMYIGSTLNIVEFEFDTNKSKANKEKHGIDFVEAQVLWADSYLLKTAVTQSDEERFRVIGKISGQHWSGFITYRKESVRIISVRHSRKKEVQEYERQKANYRKGVGQKVR